MSIGAQIIAQGKVKGTGVLAPEQAFEPTEIFSELKKRQILVHEEINPLPQTSRPICQCMKKTG
jgi:saccharopine dehydrogenase-like NADP-dependent oxidoreductase